MKKVNCIRIFFVLTVLFCIGCYQILHLKQAEQPQDMPDTEQIFAEEAGLESEEDVLPVSQPFGYKFVILEEGDYLTVYLADRRTVYEYTAIRYSDLDESLQQKIREGYCVKDEETLFGFLENYSS